MKRKFMFGLGLAAMVAAPFAVSAPVFANLQDMGSAIAQRIMRPEVSLEMGVEKQVVTIDESGQEKSEWQALSGNATVQPGDVLRYVVESSNEGEMAAKNLVITQPIPEALEFEIGSDKGNASADTTYSIDGGETFVAEPMIEVTLLDGTVEMQPAPAELYSHVKWDFNEDLESSVVVDVSLEATVK